MFKFKTQKTALKAKEKDENLEFEKQPVSYDQFIKEEYSFRGNYSLEYVPGGYNILLVFRTHPIRWRYPSTYYTIQIILYYNNIDISDHLWPKLRVSKDGELEIIGVIDEGSYNFDVVAVDFGPNSSTVLNARSRVNIFFFFFLSHHLLSFDK